jgi:hypothetical protein
MKYSITLLASFIILMVSCGDNKLFKKLSSSDTGIHFNNKIVENDSINPLQEINIYNGGGVGAGDFNNDGLIDLYFTGNMVSNQLYLNKGDLQFEDVTKISGTDGNGKWSRGVAVVDINNDGKDDIYVSVALVRNAERRKNLLYVNQGNNKEGIPVFKEMAAEYGLDDTTHTAMSYFFDYDNDGDLDVYMVVNQHVNRQNPNSFRPTITDGSHPSTGRLYQNNFDNHLKHPVFTNVSKQSGITIEGYGHAAVIADVNRDGWKDIYVTNDFNTNNILYINNRNGTFTDSAQQYLKQTSRFAMGVDMQDFNNDGLSDIVELDMNPEDNLRKKMMLEANSYQTIRNFDEFNYQYQYTHNSLQLNQGRSMKQNDSVGNYVFSQIAFQSGIAETDWSWCPIVNDFDDDGYRDIIITNGYAKDVTDHDFMVYRSKASRIATTKEIMDQVPEIKLRNYAYRNNGDLSFTNYSFDWGFDVQGFSNGGIWADLDNDGDMDIIINNINDEALVYENTGNKKENKNYLNIKFNGSDVNKAGIGAWATIYFNGQQQSYENSPYRGYVSTHQNMAHFGLGDNKKIDSLVIVWPDGKKQVLMDVKTNQLLTVNIKEANINAVSPDQLVNTTSIFRNVTDSLGINFIHHEEDYADFIIQKLLPHKFTEYSPAIAVADLDGNQLDDIVCGGNSSHPTTILLQQPNGKFTEKKLFAPVVPPSTGNVSEFYFENIGSTYKDSGILLFDADGDGDQDMYISGGGYAYKAGTDAYRDRFYINDGKGNFTLNENALPVNYTSKFCVRAADYDKDGDLDLFIAGRVAPAKYPMPVSSFILRNDSKAGNVQFTDVTKDIAPELNNIGMICDAVFSDFNNDGNIDLILAGEWMSVTFLENKNGKFSNLKDGSGINNKTGWWNSIAPGDFDNDGDIDYVIGNLGANSFFQASNKYPLGITAKDFDKNDSYDAFISKYLPVSHADTTKKSFPVHTRDEINKQMISMRAKFKNFTSYANVTMDQLFTPEEMKGAIQLHANTLYSMLIRNEGNGKFSMEPLPVAAQSGLIEAMVVEDYDGDGNLDIIINGNDYGTDVSYGRMDALDGLYLKGDGNGGFKPLSILQSGIYIPGNGKAMAQLKNREGGNLIAATQNNGHLKVFASRYPVKSIAFEPGDISATVFYKDGKKQKRELYYGYSFLSQSAAFININDKIASVEVTNSKGLRRLQVDKNR